MTTIHFPVPSVCRKRQCFFLLKTSLVASFLAISFNSLGQGNGSTMNTSTTISKKTGKMTFDEEKRSHEKMQLPETKSKKVHIAHKFVTFPFKIKPLEITSVLPKIRQQTENASFLTPQSYFKIGAGNYGTTYAEGLISNYKNEKILFGAFVKHLAARKGAVEGTASAESQNTAKIFGKYFIAPDTEIAALFQYQHKTVGFYGNPTEGVLTDFPKQKYTLLEGEITHQKAGVYAKMTLQNSLSFYQFSDDLFQNSEQNIAFKTNGIFAINDVNSLVFQGSVILNKYEQKQTESNVITDRNIFSAAASYVFQKPKFTFNAGLGFGYNADTTDTKNQLNIYPNISAKYNVIKNKLTLIAELKGNLAQQTFRSLAKENPFLASNISLKNTNNKLNASFGFQAKPTNKINIEAKAFYRIVENLHFFSNTTANNSLSEILYDSGESSILGFDFSASLKVSEFKFLLNSQFQNYDLKTLETPWHRPTIKNSLTILHHIEDGKLLLSSNFYHLGGLKAKEIVSNTTQNLDPIFDMNLKATYFFSKNSAYGEATKSDKWSAFAQVNNLLGKNYERYLYYPTKGINVLIGLEYRF